jgi:CHAP domain
MERMLCQFIARYMGVRNTGDTPQNSGQCVGLIEVWLDLLKKPHIWGDAKDLIANADLHVYKTFQNMPNNFPPPGAIVCWDGTWGNGAGHTAVVIAANVLWLAVFEQNNPINSPPIVGTHSYDGVQGWIVVA